MEVSQRRNWHWRGSGAGFVAAGEEGLRYPCWAQLFFSVYFKNWLLVKNNEMKFCFSATTPLVLDCGASPPQWGKRICDGRQQALASRRNRDHEGESQVRHAEAMT
jgi:hypothetical protein